MHLPLHRVLFRRVVRGGGALYQVVLGGFYVIAIDRRASRTV